MELVTSQNGGGGNSSSEYVPTASPVKDINDDYDIKEVCCVPLVRLYKPKSKTYNIRFFT